MVTRKVFSLLENKMRAWIRDVSENQNTYSTVSWDPE